MRNDVRMTFVIVIVSILFYYDIKGFTVGARAVGRLHCLVSV